MEGRSRHGAARRGWATNLFVRAEWEIDLGNPALPEDRLGVPPFLTEQSA